MSSSGESGQPAYGEPRFGEQPFGEQPPGSDPRGQQPGYGQQDAGGYGQSGGYEQSGYGQGGYPTGAYPTGAYPTGAYASAPYAPSGDGQPGYPAQRGTNALAIVALVLGLLIPLGGVICGFIAKRQIRRTGESGDGLATAGIVIGFVFIALTVLAVVAIAVGVHHANVTTGLVLLPH